MSITYYDREGAAVAYLDDDQEHIYAFDGSPVGYVDGEHVWSFGGQFLGWNNRGWIRDQAGDAMLYAAGAQGGPFKPFNQFEPFKGFKQFLPFKGFKQFVPFKPIFSLNWSNEKFW